MRIRIHNDLSLTLIEKSLLMANAITINEGAHAQLAGQVMEKVKQLDGATLKKLDAWLAESAQAKNRQDKGSTGKQKGLMTSRRAVLMTLLGGVALTGSGAAGHVLGESQTWTDANAQLATKTEEIEGLLEQLTVLEVNLASQRELITLYDQLDGVKLDQTVNTGMQSVLGSINNTSEYAQQLRDGLLVAKDNINQLDQGLAILDTGLVRVEGMIVALSALMQGLEDRLQAAGEPVAPVTDALGSLFENLISYLPFGIGERIQATADSIKIVIGTIPESIASLNDNLITPMRTTFFPRDGDNIQVRLLDPLTNVLFAPAEWTLSGLASLADTWDKELEQPVQEMIEKRATLREEITAYKEKIEL